MTKMPRNPRSRRRNSPGRFFLSAVLIAVAIFLVVKFVQGWRPWPAAHRQAAAPLPATAAMPDTAGSLKGFQLLLRRDGCNGECPYYALMYRAGTLQYVGVRGVSKRGKVSERIPVDEQRSLLALVDHSNFFALHDSYDLASPGCASSRADAPSFTVGVTLNGETKIIKVNEACTNVPLALRRLADGIDRTTHSARWTGVATPAAATR